MFSDFIYTILNGEKAINKVNWDLSQTSAFPLKKSFNGTEAV